MNFILSTGSYMKKLCLIGLAAATVIVLFGSCKKYYEKVPVEDVTSDYIKRLQWYIRQPVPVWYLCRSAGWR